MWTVINLTIIMLPSSKLFQHLSDQNFSGLVLSGQQTKTVVQVGSNVSPSPYSTDIVI